MSAGIHPTPHLLCVWMWFDMLGVVGAFVMCLCVLFLLFVVVLFFLVFLCFFFFPVVVFFVLSHSLFVGLSDCVLCVFFYNWLVGWLLGFFV